MRLKNAIENMEIKYININQDIEITDIAYKTENIKSGSLFVAIVGSKFNGHEFASEAIDRGAVAVLCQCKIDENIPQIVIDDTRRGLAIASKNFFHNCSEKLKIIGITGTNGKTTTTYLVKKILEDQGFKVGLIGTNQNMIGSDIFETAITTPESYEIHKLFSKMIEESCDYVVMEITSHGLQLERVFGINFEVAAFTNLTQDHLDFHGTMENYHNAKAKLFNMANIAVLNSDDKASEKFKEYSKVVMEYSTENKHASIYGSNIEMHRNKVNYQAINKQTSHNIQVNIPGMFSVYNSLCAILICYALGIDIAKSAHSLLYATGVKGRVEDVPVPRDFNVIIDYAHSEDGIKNVLKAVRGFAKGRIVSVFGCGGDRDKTKRPLMGRASFEMADVSIVTSDNPRSEDPNTIIADILKGNERYDNYTVIPDRRKAIRHSLEHGEKDDMIILFGKGHETYQEINGVKYPFDEREEIENYFKNEIGK